MTVLILAALLIGDRIRFPHVLACLLGAAGVALLVLRGSAKLDTVGVLAALAAAVCMAAGITLTKLWGRPDGVRLLSFTGWQLVAGGLVVLPFTLLVEGVPGSLSLRNVIGFTYLVTLGAVLSYALWFRGIERLPALAVSFLALGSPIVATVLGYVFRDQTFSLLQFVGVVVIIAAVVLAQTQPTQPRRPQESPQPDGDRSVTPRLPVSTGTVRPERQGRVDEHN
jgi:probable blue pigment (indigoidine) exporter